LQSSGYGCIDLILPHLPRQHVDPIMLRGTSRGLHLIHCCCRFVATEESYAHPLYKRKLIEYDKTEYTDIFGRARWPGAPQRALMTPFFSEWPSLHENEDEANQPVIGRSTIHGVVNSRPIFLLGLIGTDVSLPHNFTFEENPTLVVLIRSLKY